jgi:hypothetical protein
MSHIKSLNEMQDDLANEIKVRIAANNELHGSMLKYFPKNVGDLKTLENYGKFLVFILQTIEDAQ